MGKTLIDLTNQNFGRLTVLKRSPCRRSGGARWIVSCQCGTVKEVSGQGLRGQRIRSCGCWRKERASRILLHTKKSDAAFNSLLYSYKRGAKLRNIPFSLTREEFLAFLTQLCYYCKSRPSNCRATNYGARIIYNGIDRKDSQKGYTPENCVP